MDESLLDEFEGLLTAMEDALVKNNTDNIEKITNLEQTCLFHIVKRAKTDEVFKAQIRERVPIWIKQLEVNKKLLNQAVAINGNLISLIYSNQTVY